MDPPLDLERYRGQNNLLEHEHGSNGIMALYYHPEVQGSPVWAARFLGYTDGARSNMSKKWKDLGLRPRKSNWARPPVAFPRALEQPTEDEPLECIDKEIEDPHLIERLWGAAEAVRLATEAANTEQDRAGFRLRETAPVGIWSLSDIHIGHDRVPHLLVKETVDLLAAEPGLYGILNGDVIDGFVANTPDTGRFSAALRPKFQKLLAVHICELLAGKVLGVTAGQHEFFSLRLDDFDFAEYMAKHARSVYLGSGGSMTLQFVDGVTYSIGVWHRFPGRSIYDKTAAAKRLYREHGPFDVTFVGDKHSPAISKEIRNGEWRVFAQGGTYKVHDDYGKALGYLDSAVAVPMAILWPREKRYWVGLDISEGLDYLRWLRAEEAAA